MLKRYGTAIAVGLLLLALLFTVYLSQNQADYDKRTLQPYEYQDMASDPMFFEKGTYAVTFTYTYAPDVQVQIVRSTTADANNALPAVLFSAPLTQSGQTMYTLTLGEAVFDLQFRYTGETELGFTNVESLNPIWRDTWLILLLIVFAAAVPGFTAWCERKRQTVPEPNGTGMPESTVYLLLTAAAVFATLPVLRDFLINGHDLAYHLLRIEAVKDGLLDGQFPVRIGPTYWNGLGYASSVMYPELFLYLPAAFRLCGVSLLASYQAFIFLINLATLLVTYHAVKRLTGKAAVGLIVSLAYGLGVNRLITLYTRAAMGEALALIFFPCVMLGMAEVLHRGKLSRWLIFGMTGLIQSHIVSVEIAAIFCAAYTVIAVVLRKTTGKSLLRLAAAAGITVLLNLWFLVPFFRFAQENLRMFDYTTRTMLHAVYPAQWFASFVDPFGNAEYLGTTAEMPLSVGLLPWIGILLYLLKGREENRTLRYTGHASLGFGLAALLVSSTLFPWTYVAKIPVLGELLYAAQFPWRYLGLAGFLLAMVFGLGAYGVARGRGRLLIAACLILTAFNAAPFLDQYVQAEDQVYVMRTKTDTAALEAYATWDYCYADTDFELMSAQAMQITAPPEVSITGFTKLGTQVSFAYASGTEQSVTLPLYLYPGYTATLNGAQALEIRETNHLLTLALPAGEGTVFVRYTGLWYFNLANFLSLFTLLALLALAVRKLPRRKRKPRQPEKAAV